MSFNTRSILDINRRIKLSNIILSNDYDIICLSETWLTENIPDNALFLPAHIITRCDRPTNSTKSKHGGVLIAVKQSLAFTKLEIHTTDCVGLLLNTPTPLILCCIYSAPNESKYKLSTDDFNKLLNLLTDYSNEFQCPNILLVGDINFANTHWQTLQSTQKHEQLVLQTFTDMNFQQFIEPPHDQLDIVLCNNPDIILNTTIDNHMKKHFSHQERELSDHNPFLITISSLKLIALEKHLTIALEKHMKKQTKHRMNLAPWITPETSNIIKRLNTASKKVAFKNTHTNNLNLERLKNLVDHLSELDQKNFEESTFKGRNFSKLQKYFKSIRKNSSTPKTMYWNEKTESTEHGKANILNNYFVSVFIIKQNENILPIAELPGSIKCFNFSENEIYDILKTLNLQKARGPDRLGNTVLTNLADSITPSLKLIYNTITNKATFPTIWKLSQIIPTFKNGNKQSVTNYRPISLLTAVSKVLEKLIFLKISPKIFSQIHDSQFGFCPKRSITLQMLQFLDKIYDDFDNPNIKSLQAIYLDFEKAFDKVPHDLCIYKLNKFGISGNALKLLANYLTNRKQQVRIGAAVSSHLEVSSGVPQGSLLGPVLFITFINDLPSSLTNSCYGYADDYKIVATNPSLLQHDLITINLWCKDNSMSLKLKKCHNIIFKDPQLDLNMYLGDHILEKTCSEKDLGIQITNNLNWSAHAKIRAQKAIGCLFLIKRNISKSASLKMKLNSYCGYITPIVSYGSPIWKANKCELKIIEDVQRKATRSILSCNNINYKDGLIRLNLLPLSLYHEMQDILLLHKIINDQYNFHWRQFVQFKESTAPTRRSTKNNLAHKNYHYEKSKSNFWHRTPILANKILQTQEEEDLFAMKYERLKSSLKNVFWIYFISKYEESVPCTWRINCCNSCVNSKKL